MVKYFHCISGQSFNMYQWKYLSEFDMILYYPTYSDSFSGEHVFTLKEDVDVADKALAAEVRDNMEPWRLRLVSEP